MRIRVLGQHVPASLAVLALIEVGLAFLAVYAAVLLRFQTRFSHLSNLERELGPLWPRGLVFSAIVGVCLLAFGLYSKKARRQTPTIALNTSPRGHSGPSSRSRFDKWLKRV